MKVERILTNIPGLDEMIGGGIPKGNSILLAGSPGNGKSILAMQYLYKGFKDQEEPGIYVSLKETPETIRKNFSTINWDISQTDILSILPYKHKIGDKTNYVIPPEISQQRSFTKKFLSDDIFTAKRFSADNLRKLLRKEIKRIKAKRIVIDPITPLVLNSKGDFEARQEILAINDMLKELGCTSIMTTNILNEKPTFTNLGLEAFVMDGLIMLYNIKKGNIRERGLEVLKMNGAKHSNKTCSMEITDEGIVVHPQKELFT